MLLEALDEAVADHEADRGRHIDVLRATRGGIRLEIRVKFLTV